jgi:hypothetical protein
LKRHWWKARKRKESWNDACLCVYARREEIVEKEVRKAFSRYFPTNRPQYIEDKGGAPAKITSILSATMFFWRKRPAY